MNAVGVRSVMALAINWCGRRVAMISIVWVYWREKEGVVIRIRLCVTCKKNICAKMRFIDPGENGKLTVSSPDFLSGLKILKEWTSHQVKCITKVGVSSSFYVLSKILGLHGQINIPRGQIITSFITVLTEVCYNCSKFSHLISKYVCKFWACHRISSGIIILVWIPYECGFSKR